MPPKEETQETRHGLNTQIAQSKPHAVWGGGLAHKANKPRQQGTPT